MPKLQTKPQIKLIAGLGNPGEEYTNTFHNAGFKFVEFLSGNESIWKETDSFFYFKYEKIILAKTKSFMNDSGRSVSKMLHYFNVRPEEIILAHDDSDLTLGEYKIQFNKGAAGHKGVSSVISNIKSKEFWRVRIGIRESVNGIPRKKAGDFVLKKITSTKQKELEKCFSSIKEDLEI